MTYFTNDILYLSCFGDLNDDKKNITGLLIDSIKMKKILDLNFSGNIEYKSFYDKDIDLKKYKVIIINELLPENYEKSILYNYKKHKLQAIIQIKHLLWQLPELDKQTYLCFCLRSDLVNSSKYIDKSRIFPYHIYINEVDCQMDLNERFDNLLYVGRINKYKTTTDLFRFFYEHPQYDLDIYGSIDEEFKDEFENILELNKNIHYKGYIEHDKIYCIYQKYKYFILNSDTDIYSISLAEAISNGCLPFAKSRYIDGQNILKWHESIIEYDNNIDLQKLLYIEFNKTDEQKELEFVDRIFKSHEFKKIYSFGLLKEYYCGAIKSIIQKINNGC